MCRKLIVSALLVSVLHFHCTQAYVSREDLQSHVGPAVTATKGEIWPRPQLREYSQLFYILRPSHFQFNVTRNTCNILQNAVVMYQDIIAKFNRQVRVLRQRAKIKRQLLYEDPHMLGYLEALDIQLMAPCEDYPYYGMDEHYNIRITNQSYKPAILTSQSIWGILRGLESFVQILTTDSQDSSLIINCTSIMDFPRFKHRGLLVDTARHFIPFKTLLTMLDAMAMNKMNVLHWHIVDDQSFPFKSDVYPELSEKGAYNPLTHIYTTQDVRQLVDYARLRGIRVIPEFDVPGHTRSWGEAHPSLLTPCYSNQRLDGTLGPMDPTQAAVYKFVKNLFSEVKELFPDDSMHVGGDEVPFDCWESNPRILDYMRRHSYNPAMLQSMFMKKAINIVSNMSAHAIVWQEVFDNGDDIQLDTIIQVWKGGFENELYQVTSSGYKAILSSCWYLDHLKSGGDWQDLYRCDPHRFLGTDQQKALVIGGEACMWAEVVDVNNIFARVWPRASAVAEKLWSNAKHTLQVEEAARRLEEHYCRMNQRGFAAQPPNGPGYCKFANY